MGIPKRADKDLKRKDEMKCFIKDKKNVRKVFMYSRVRALYFKQEFQAALRSNKFCGNVGFSMILSG